MELLHLFRFLLGLDKHWLRPLRYWAPDLQEVVNNPRKFFQDREIEIGPWTRYVRSYVVPILLTIPALLAIVRANSPVVTIGVSLAWLMIAGGLVHACRGGRCILQAAGVEFQYRGTTVFCPWDLFHTTGLPMYYPERWRLDIPVALNAIASIEVWQNAGIVAQGLDAQAKHVQVLPTGEIRLKFVYGVKPDELGQLLLELGRNLGTPDEWTMPEVPSVAPLKFQRMKGDWIRVKLTRLRFPPICCDCEQPTDRWQEFRGYRSISVDDFATFVAPVCSKCQRVNRGRYWRTLFKFVFLTVIGVTALCFLVGIILDLCGLTPAPRVMTILMTFCGFLASLGLSWFFAAKRARAVSAPLSLADYRSDEGTIQIRFRNGKYAEMFLADL